jgi:c(7)-type cytochrome triheme protein
MRLTLVFPLAVALVSGAALTAPEKKPPARLVFHNKGGDVPFDHAAHLAREGGSCAACHDDLWPQSAAQPLANSNGCKTCHQPGGKAFETKGHCQTCHPTAGGKSAKSAT